MENKTKSIDSGSFIFSVTPDVEEERKPVHFTVLPDGATANVFTENTCGSQNSEQPITRSYGGDRVNSQQGFPVSAASYPAQTDSKIYNEIIRTEGTKQRLMAKADISKLAAMQQLNFEFLPGGYVQIRMELFCGEKKGRVHFQIKERPKRIFCNEESWSILAASFIRQDGVSVELLLKESDICGRIVNRRFDALGLRLGYGSRKERELRELFVADLVSIAENVVLPRRHGWHRNDAGEWGFSFPEEITWEEVAKNA